VTSMSMLVGQLADALAGMVVALPAAAAQAPPGPARRR